MPRISQNDIARRETLANDMFIKGATYDQVQASLVALDGYKMTPTRLMEIQASVLAPQALPEFKPIAQPKPVHVYNRNAPRALTVDWDDPVYQDKKLDAVTNPKAINATTGRTRRINIIEMN
jgi:hypothetical protein